MFCHLPNKMIGFQAPKGSKVPDWLGADCCKACHDILDGAEGRNDHGLRMRALCLTIQRRFDSGHLEITGEHGQHYFETED